MSVQFCLIYPVAALCVFAVAGFLLFEYRVRRQRQRGNEAKLSSLVEERTLDLELRSKALEESERRFRQLAENIHQVFWMFDPRSDKFLYLSPAYRTLWLREPQVVLSDSSQWFAYVHPEDLPQLKIARQSELRGQTTDLEYRIVRSDGSIRWVWNRSFPVFEETGELDRTVGILEDVTARREAQDALQQSRDEMSARIFELKFENKERRRAEEELKAAKELAETASRSKSEFLANVSHEIRTPLNGISGMLQLALDTDLSQEQREFLQLVRTSADSLLDIINDVLDFSKVEAGKLTFEMIDVDIRRCVEKSVRSLAVSAHRKGLELNYYVESDVPAVIVSDPTRLSQVIINLVGNAIKFTETGEVYVQVKKGDEKDGHTSLHFTITDTGVGIPHERQQAIFEAFTQADGSSTRKHGGTGLGLSISSQLVTLMGGKLWVRSEPGSGSVFGFEAAFACRTASPGVKKESLAAFRPVLAVIPHQSSRQWTEESLRQAGVEAYAAASFDEALMLIERDPGRFGAVITESGLTEYSGFALVERLRTIPSFSAITLMVLNSAKEFAEATLCRDSKIDGHMTKPLNYAELAPFLVRLMAKADLQQSSAEGASDSPKTEPTRKALRILLVEDNPVNRKVATKLLEKRGDEVFQACNGLEALAKLEELGWNVDLALMDIQMPEMDGYQATAAIRKQEKLRGTHLPIIAVTAHAFEQDREDCLAAGMDGYVSKPIQAKKLVEVICETLKIVHDASESRALRR